ncbi:antigen [Bacillus thuringiensis serovar kurstaki str. HD-1]|nr:hypothetical protein [Bacillus thuringiensis]AIE33784.1 antigen [Bacillus thuringiensis serovar kurstaki str. HD-1]
MQKTDGEPDTLRDVSPVRGGTFGNLSQECNKAAGCLLYTYATKVNEKTKLIEKLLRNVHSSSK